jgi:hypothetical protein
MLSFMLTSKPGKNKTTRTKKDREKGIIHTGGVCFRILDICYRIQRTPAMFALDYIPYILRVSVLYYRSCHYVIQLELSQRSCSDLIYSRSVIISLSRCLASCVPLLDDGLPALLINPTNRITAAIWYCRTPTCCVVLYGRPFQ